jgi:hypothetical protein
MKTRRLNDTDFAKLTVLTEDQQWRKLLKMTGTFAPYTLTPVRRAFPDIFNLEMPLFSGASHEHVDISRILESVGKRCRSEFEKEQNEEVAILLHSLSMSKVQASRSLNYTSLKLGENRPFWQPKYLVMDGRPVIFQVDPRGTEGLTAEARRIFFSGMDIGVRQIDTDFEDARLLVIHLPRIRGRRHLRLHWADDIDLLSYTELQEKSAVTESLWLAAQHEQERQKRGSSGTGTGPLI